MSGQPKYNDRVQPSRWAIEVQNQSVKAVEAWKRIGPFMYEDFAYTLTYTNASK